MQTIIESIRARAIAHPERDALVKADARVSYGALWHRIASSAGQLAARGVRPGNRVLIPAPSTPSFVYAYFGAHLLGAIAVPIDPVAPASRRQELLERTGAHAIELASELPPAGGAPFTPPSLDADADLLFTTGSTGRPKGVRLTHGNIATSGAHINAVIRTPEAAVEVLPLPLYHAFGLGRLRCDLLAGRTVVLVDGFRLPGEIFAAIEKHNAAGLVGVPAGFALLLTFGARGLGRYASQLRYVEIGSSPMPEVHKKALIEFLPSTELWMHYGLTEAARSVFIEFHRHRERLDTVGRAAPGVRLDIRSYDGRPLEPSEPGLLWIGGAHISPGYWDDDALSSETFAGGWARTGDVATLDPEGFLRLHGRSDDMMKIGGFNVSPDEIEKVLAAHPVVREAACVGVPDPKRITGQAICAYVVLSAPAESKDSSELSALSAALSAWVATHLESYKVPVLYKWVSALPRTESGKLLRKDLRG